MRSASRPYLLCAVLLASAAVSSQAGLTPYTERGKTDFDTALHLLNPYGTWSKIDNVWAYTPTDHLAPYTDGRWIYTEYGWYWKGNLPHSWVTEHYGYWKRGADKVWSWYPGPFWLPQIVELRQTSTHIGWRSGPVDQDGNFIEAPADRYAKTDEWTFVTMAQFAGPITPQIVASPQDTATLLEDSVESSHTYFTYHEIDRPGPHPADFLKFGTAGGMLAPITLEDRLAAQPPPPSPLIPGLNATSAAVNAKIAAMTGTNAPSFVERPSPGVDTRKVKYWITMSLPTFWTKPPPDARPEEIYLYRPDFYQDNDGIARRITLWFNPMSRTSLKVLLGDKLPGAKPGSPQPKSTSGPAQSNPFQSPLDDSYQPDANAETPPPRTPSASSKNPTPPSGLKQELDSDSLPTTNAPPEPPN